MNMPNMPNIPYTPFTPVIRRHSRPSKLKKRLMGSPSEPINLTNYFDNLAMTTRIQGFSTPNAPTNRVCPFAPLQNRTQPIVVIGLPNFFDAAVMRLFDNENPENLLNPENPGNLINPENPRNPEDYTTPKKRQSNPRQCAPEKRKKLNDNTPFLSPSVQKNLFWQEALIWDDPYNWGSPTSWDDDESSFVSDEINFFDDDDTFSISSMSTESGL